MKMTSYNSALPASNNYIVKIYDLNVKKFYIVAESESDAYERAIMYQIHVIIGHHMHHGLKCHRYDLAIYENNLRKLQYKIKYNGAVMPIMC
ncbi:hypothetical protein CE11_00098 [Megavirus courdo11]|uniref:Uncharacterized protein n=2 Tax=Megavirus chilense TaxID=3060301 RepID=G5CR19_9VIRU|nr:hypothetical protein MegaChil _gp0107 [Megavirus chiliensis]AEQ33418.1 hypothetical protein [Megavirus chiliensis]AFX92130.1 hypothetical protein CE11_00098 [Megavirus courdo11]